MAKYISRLSMKKENVKFLIENIELFAPGPQSEFQNFSLEVKRGKFGRKDKRFE